MIALRLLTNSSTYALHLIDICHGMKMCNKVHVSKHIGVIRRVKYHLLGDTVNFLAKAMVIALNKLARLRMQASGLQ